MRYFWHKANWSRLIQKVYEFDPLECPNCCAAAFGSMSAHTAQRRRFSTSALQMHPATSLRTVVKTAFASH